MTSEWKDIASAPNMYVVLLHHRYYSHGQLRQGYQNAKGVWLAVNANGTEADLGFDPTYWQPLPQPPVSP
jgi:hypothetical protein